ncbi:BTB/POZ domain-containing protein NPY2, partial [Vitis vinifera]
VGNRPVVPKDWWVEDLCELEIDLYKRVIMSIKTQAVISHEVIGEALKAFALKRLPGFSKGMIPNGDTAKFRSTVDTIVWLLPADKCSVSCSFLLKLLKAAIFMDSGERAKRELVRRIGQQLEEASVNDLLIRAPEGETARYDVDTVQQIVEEFLMQEQNAEIESTAAHELQEVRRPGILSDASKLMVAKLVDGYLAEIAKDPNLPLSKFVDLAELVSGFSRPAHDGLYRAIDMYLKEHPGISKSERKRICRLMDCKKLSVDACMHAVQNERLPLRVVVQCIPRQLKVSNNQHRRRLGCCGHSGGAQGPQGELASLRLGNGVGASERNGGDSKGSIDKAAINKMKGLLMSKKIFTKLWSSKSGQGENSGSDSSGSSGSANPEEAKSTPSRNRRHSVS